MIGSLLLVSQLMTWTLLEAGQASGDPMAYPTTQDLALAGAVFFSPGLIMKNPASVALHQGWETQASGQWALYQEQRSEPVYDPFNNTVGYATVYSRYQPDLFLQSWTVVYATGKAGIGVSWDRPVSKTYRFDKEDRLDVYTPIRREIEEWTGALGRLTVAFGLKIQGWLLGAAYQAHRAEVRHFYDLWTPETGDSIAAETLNLRGSGYAMALGYRWGYRMKLGVSYRSGFSDPVLAVPSQWDLAAELTPRTRRPSRIFLRIGRETWSQVSSAYRDIWRFHFGIRHGLFPRMSFMIGGMLRQSYVKDLWLATYTGGLSHTVVPGLTIDVGIAVTPISHGQWINGTWNRIYERLTQVSWGIRWTR